MLARSIPSSDVDVASAIDADTLVAVESKAFLEDPVRRSDAVASGAGRSSSISAIATPSLSRCEPHAQPSGRFSAASSLGMLVEDLVHFSGSRPVQRRCGHVESECEDQGGEAVRASSVIRGL